MSPSAIHPPAPTTKPLHLLIIGGGLCGLAAAISTSLSGHTVTIFESVPQLHEIGAGLQVTPNGTRLLRRWGLTPTLSQSAAVPTSLSIHRYDGKILAHRKRYDREIAERYNSPLWCLHRVDLQKAMGARAVELGVNLRLGTRVADVDFDAAAVVLESGERVQGDVVLAADGLWSGTRSKFMGRAVPPKPTGDLAYRILLDAGEIEDPELREWITEPAIHIWIGPETHAVGYSIQGGRMYNMVLLVPDDLPEEVARQKGDLEEMRRLFVGWDPVLTRFLEKVEKVDKWRLMHIPPVESPWKSPKGTFAMAGDSCHPMLPYLAQGANSSLEDGAVLGALLGKVTSKSQIPAAIAMYEKMRKARVGRIAPETFAQGEEFHLPDGPEQEKRDALLARSFEPVDESTPVDSRWTHPKIQPWIFGYDAYAEVEKAFAAQPF